MNKAKFWHKMYLASNFRSMESSTPICVPTIFNKLTIHAVSLPLQQGYQGSVKRRRHLDLSQSALHRSLGASKVVNENSFDRCKPGGCCFGDGVSMPTGLPRPALLPPVIRRYEPPNHAASRTTIQITASFETRWTRRPARL